MITDECWCGGHVWTLALPCVIHSAMATEVFRWLTTWRSSAYLVSHCDAPQREEVDFELHTLSSPG